MESRRKTLWFDIFEMKLVHLDRVSVVILVAILVAEMDAELQDFASLICKTLEQLAGDYKSRR